MVTTKQNGGSNNPGDHDPFDFPEVTDISRKSSYSAGMPLVITIGVVCGVGAVLVIGSMVGIGYFIYTRRKPKKNRKDESPRDEDDDDDWEFEDIKR